MSYEGQRIHYEYITYAKLGSPIDLKQSWDLRNLGPWMSKWESFCIVHNPKEDSAWIQGSSWPLVMKKIISISLSVLN